MEGRVGKALERGPRGSETEGGGRSKSGRGMEMKGGGSEGGRGKEMEGGGEEKGG